MEKHPSGPARTVRLHRVTEPPSLSDLGISKRDSSDWQKISRPGSRPVPLRATCAILARQDRQASVEFDPMILHPRILDAIIAERPQLAAEVHAARRAVGPRMEALTAKRLADEFISSITKLPPADLARLVEVSVSPPAEIFHQTGRR